MSNYDDNKYTSIIPTAYATAYPRTLTDTPYWKEIFDQLERLRAEEQLPKIDDDLKVVRLAPELEARYKLIDKLLQETHITQILELAAGLSPRGLIATSDEAVRYVEFDLSDMARMKRSILSRIKTVPSNLMITEGNALKVEDLERAVAKFDTTQPLAVVHEGLLRYLNFDEKAQVAKNVKTLLQRFGGVWITCDTIPKKFLEVQDTVMNPSFNKTFISKTGKNFYDNMFEDEQHVIDFFGNLGFSVEMHKFDEVIDKLVSPAKLNLSQKETRELLKSGTVAVMRLSR